MTIKSTCLFDGVMDMKIREVNENKKQFILEDGNVKAECVVTDEGNEILEIKNIAVDVVMLLCMYQLK